jgi:Ca2+-binding RTX toxin-like protein
MEQVLISLISARTLDSEDGLISGGPASIVNERYTWLTIFNDDVLPPPTIALSSADPITIPEGPTTRFTHALMFTLHRSGNLAESSNFTFTLTPEPGSSLTTEDIGDFYLGSSQYVGSGLGSFTGDFPAGVDSRNLTIFVTTDRVPEPDESFRLTLTGASGATLSATGPLSAVGNITNDDVYPTIGWAATAGGSTPEGSDPSFRGLLEFEITRSGDLSYASTVTFSVGPGAGGTTADDIEVVGIHGTGISSSGFGTHTFSFAADQATARVFLLAAGDRIPEADESVVLTLLSATEGTLVQPDARVTTGRITNDDVPNQGPIATDDVLNVLVPFGATEVIIPFSGLTANDRDPDGSFLSVIGIANGVGALIDQDDGYLQLLDITGSVVTFTYDVRDADNATGTAAVTVNLSFAPDPNRPPSTVDDVLTFNVPFVGPSGSQPPLYINPADLLANDTDPDIADGETETLSITQITNVTGATVNHEGLIEMTNYDNGPVTFTYQAKDSTGLSDTANVTVNLRFAPDPNRPPTAVDDVLTFNVPFVGPSGSQPSLYINPADLLANDPDPDIADGEAETLSITQITNVTGATVNHEGFIEITNYDSGPVTFTYRATDSTGLSDTAAVTVNLNFAPDPIQPPTDIALSNARIYENMPADSLIGLLSGVDPDNGDSLIFSFAPNSNSLGLFKIEGNQLRTTASLDYEIASSHSLNLRVTDATGNSFDKAFNIAVDDVSERPGSGNDVVIGTLLKDVLRSRGGDDQVFALNGNDIVFGGSGNDKLYGGEGNDSLNGESGIDHLYGEAGDDILKAGTGNDFLSGGDANDNLNGESGVDQLEGGAGNDILKGGVGNDFLSGGDDNDKLWGQDGSDTLVGGVGNDILDGGAGKDLYLYLANILGTDDLIGGTTDLIKASKGDKIVFTADVWDDFGLTNGALGKTIDSLHSLAFNNRQIQIDVNGDGAFTADLDVSIDLVGVNKVSADTVGHFLILL